MSDKVESWLKYGLSQALDLPTEGVTPSNYPRADSGARLTEQYPPNNATPRANNGGGGGMGGNMVMLGVAGVGLLLIAKIFKVL